MDYLHKISNKVKAVFKSNKPSYELYEYLYTALQELAGLQLLRSPIAAWQRGGSFSSKGGSSMGRVDFLLFPLEQVDGDNDLSRNSFHLAGNNPVLII